MESCVRQGKTLKREYTESEADKTPVLKVNIAVPEICGSSALRLNAAKLYDGVYQGFLGFCEDSLYKRARKELKLSRKSEDKKFAPFCGMLGYTLSYENGLFVSLFTDACVFDGEKRSKTVRMAQVWSKSEGRLLCFRDFFERADRERLISLFRAEAEAKAKNGTASYRRGVVNLIESEVDFSRFYLVDGGYAFYYPAGVLSPSLHPEVFIKK